MEVLTRIFQAVLRYFGYGGQRELTPVRKSSEPSPSFNSELFFKKVTETDEKSPPPKKRRKCRYKRVFRLLRDKERIKSGISARDPDAHVSVDNHVAYGSKRKSQYISTSSNLRAIQELVGYKIYGDIENIRIVKINLRKLMKENPDAKVIDLTDDDNVDRYLKSSRAKSFAIQFDEVLIKDWIPPSAVKLIYKGHKKDMYDEDNWIEYDDDWFEVDSD